VGSLKKDIDLIKSENTILKELLMKIAKQTEKEDPIEAIVKKQLRLKALAILADKNTEEILTGLYPELDLINSDAQIWNSVF
jgi:hypothetical protein